MVKKQPQKRLPHGVTMALVFDALCRLSISKSAMRGVSRAELLDALPQLSETTVDDRLRTLKELGRIVSWHGIYQPYMPSLAYIPAPRWYA